MYVILGFGKTGQGVARFLESQNLPFKIYDENPQANSNYIFYTQLPSQSITAIIASPGFSTKYNPIHPITQIAKSQNIPIISDFDLFFQHFPNKKYIGITGTNGKSTTATLVYEIFKKAGIKTGIGGNIGISPFESKKMLEADACILEISSFQLEITHSLHLAISTITNITPDHLNRYKTMENYAHAKLKIASISQKCLINSNISNNLQNSIEVSTQKENEGYYIKNGTVHFQKTELFPLPQPKTPQNFENILNAIAICHQFGIKNESITSAIQEFKGIEHRVEFCKTISEIEFYNDSKATNLESTLNALQILNRKNIFLIIGGILADSIENIFTKQEFASVKMIAIIGQDAGKIKKEIQKTNIKHFLCGSLEKAVPLLFQEAKKTLNSAILLSPLCKSFDQFTNFEERGKTFKKIVEKINV